MVGTIGRTLAEFPGTPEALLARGSAYAMLGQFMPAIADFSEVVDRNPDHADALKRRGQTYAAVYVGVY